MTRRTRTKSRRRSWRRTSAGPNTASRASWGTDVSEPLAVFVVADVGKWGIVGTEL